MFSQLSGKAELTTWCPLPRPPGARSHRRPSRSGIGGGPPPSRSLQAICAGRIHSARAWERSGYPYAARARGTLTTWCPLPRPPDARSRRRPSRSGIGGGPPPSRSLQAICAGRIHSARAWERSGYPYAARARGTLTTWCPLPRPPDARSRRRPSHSGRGRRRWSSAVR